MKLSVRNVRAIESADIELGELVLVTGENRSGKSSICKALAACLLGAPGIIMSGRSKEARARGVVREGEEEAAAKLSSGDGHVLVSWPSEEVKTKGRPPHASPIAAGVVTFTDMPHKERARFVVDLLGLEPSRAELADALGDVGAIVGPEDSDRLWKTIEDKGWDDAAKSYADSATKGKGAWERATRAKWGEKAATLWKPAGYENVDILTFDGKGLEAGVAKAQIALDEAKRAVAVTDAERERMQEQVARIPAITAALESTRAHLRDLKAEIDHCTPIHAPVTCSCPECGGEVVWLPDGKIGKASENGAYDADAERAKAIRKAELVPQWGKKQDEERSLCHDLANAQTAEVRLRELAAKPSSDAQTVEQATLKLHTSQAHVAAFKAAREAADIHREIMLNLAIAKVLGPEGIRAEKASAGLAEINRTMFELTDETSWPTVTITPDFEVVGENRRPYTAMTPSEQFRADTVLQLEIARRDGSDMVVIDGADIVVGLQARNDMIEIIWRAEIAAVIGMAVSSPEAAPDLGKAGLGRTYFCENSTARPLSEISQAEAA